MRRQWASIVAGVIKFSSCVVQARFSTPTVTASHVDLVNRPDGL